MMDNFKVNVPKFKKISYNTLLLTFSLLPYVNLFFRALLVPFIFFNSLLLILLLYLYISSCFTIYISTRSLNKRIITTKQHKTIRKCEKNNETVFCSRE